MPVSLEGSCHCGAVRFACESHTPQPYQRCYCSICRKTAGGGGFAINIMADNASMKITDPDQARMVYRAKLEEGEISLAERSFCGRCGSPLWLWDPRWPELIHPIASAIDSGLPVPAESTHIVLGSKAAWVVPAIGPQDRLFEGYPDQSIEDWHRTRNSWID